MCWLAARNVVIVYCLSREHQIQSYNLFKLPLILIYLKRLHRLLILLFSFFFVISSPILFPISFLLDLRLLTSFEIKRHTVWGKEAFTRRLFSLFNIRLAWQPTAREKSSLQVCPHLGMRSQLPITSLQQHRKRHQNTFFRLSAYSTSYGGNFQQMTRRAKTL